MWLVGHGCCTSARYSTPLRSRSTMDLHAQQCEANHPTSRPVSRTEGVSSSDHRSTAWQLNQFPPGRRSLRWPTLTSRRSQSADHTVATMRAMVHALEVGVTDRVGEAGSYSTTSVGDCKQPLPHRCDREYVRVGSLAIRRMFALGR